MMRGGWLAERLGAVLLLSLGLLLWLLSRDALAQLRLGEETDVILLADALDESRYDEMLELEAAEAELLRFALWTELGSQWVEAPGLERGLSLSVLPVRGETRLMLPPAGGLAENDTQGCLLDLHSARSLFGSAEAVGAVLRWNGADYTVRGVFAGPKGTLLLRPPAGTALDRVSVAGSGRAAFAIRHSLTAAARVSGSVLWESGRLLSATPLLAAMLLLFGQAVWLLRGGRGYPVKTAVWGAAAFALGTLGGLLLLELTPSPLIPSRWSDFAGWGSAVSAAAEQAMGWLSAAWYRPDRRALGLLARCALGVAGGKCLVVGAGFLRG